MTRVEQIWTQCLLDTGKTVDTSPVELLNCLRNWLAGGAVKLLIGEILRDPAALRSVCSYSFLHPLGVWKVVLATSGPSGLELRIHLWDEDSKQNHGWADYLHNHKWSFASHILFGAVETSIFSEDVPGLRCRQKELVTSGIGSKRTMRTIGVFNMGEALRTKMSPGDSYFLHASAIHLIEPLEPLPVATMMLRGKYVRDNTDTFSFSPDDYPDENGRTTSSISEEKVRVVLKRALGAIDT